MMNFRQLLESILLEATPDEIYNSYYSDIPRDEFDQIVMSDPQTKVNEKGIQRIGKYAKLLINLVRKKTLKIEDLPRAKEYLSYVYKHSIGLDSNKIKSLNDLYDLVKGYYAKDTRDLGSIISALDEKEYRKVYEGEKWTIYVPLTEKASCYLGVNTEWCTTWGPQSLNPKHQERTSMFKRYGSSGSLYILINKENIDEKYQFHFQSKQYMDKEDKKINVSDFLNSNEDVKYFFFPSLIKDEVDKDMLNDQIERLNALDEDDVSIVINKLVSGVSKDNPIIKSLVGRDVDTLKSLVTDDDVEDIDIDGDNLKVVFKNSFGGGLRSVYDTLSYYRHDANDSREVLWDRMNNEDTDYVKEILERYLEEYYNENSEDLKINYGYTSYDEFKLDHYDNFTENDNIWEWYSDIYVDKNAVHLEDAAQEQVNSINKYIDFEGYDETVDVSIPYLILFLAKSSNPINVIDGKENYMVDILDDYCRDYDIDFDYEGIWDHDYTEVTYKDLEKPITDYFEGVFSDFEGMKECAEQRRKLNDVIQKIFKGQDRIENEEFSIYIPSMKINCETGSVNVIIYNKKTNTRDSGPVKIDNLATYATNYKLFENVKNIKNLL